MKNSSPATGMPRLDLSTVRVLIADDNPRALDLLSQVLLGFQVRNATVCSTIAEAVPILSRSLHDLVIVDGEMPDQDGYDLTRQLRSEPDGPNYTTPIVIVSGLTPQHRVEKARDSGANSVITKPIVPGVLLAQIEYLAKTPRPFVACPTYCGPDRRFHTAPLPEGVEERRAEAIRLMAQPDRALSQTDIDSLFG